MVVVVGILTVFAIATLSNLDLDLLAFSGYPSFDDIVSSVALTFFAFLGFGVITFTAKDLADPRRELPRAVYLALAIATVVYVAVALGVFGTLTVDEVIDSGGTALAVAAEPVLGSAGYWLMSVTALFATAGATNSGLYPAAGLCERDGRGRAVPAGDGSPARRTGRRSGIVVTAVAAIVLAVVLRPERHRLDRQRRRPDRLHPGHAAATSGSGTRPGARRGCSSWPISPPSSCWPRSQSRPWSTSPAPRSPWW